MNPIIYDPSIYKGAGVYNIGGGSGELTQLKKIYPNKFCVVDGNGYIGEIISEDLYYYSIVCLDADYSGYGLGQVVFYEEDLGQVVIYGKTYNTTKLGGLKWTSENLVSLFTGIDNNPAGEQTTPALYYQDEAFKETYGYLYNSYAADYIENNIQLPDGWRIPTKDDFENLVSLMGGTNKFVKFLLAGSWSSGADVYHFSAIPGGYYSNGYYGNQGISTNYWSKTHISATDCYYLGFLADNTDSGVKLQTNIKLGFSLRLCKDA